MAISSSYNYSSTRDTLIAGALRVLGVLAQGASPDASQLTNCGESLNLIVKAWASEGLPIWLIKKQSVTLTTSVNTYAIGLSQTVNVAKPLKVYQVFRRNTSSNIDIPLQELSQWKYNELSQKSSTGSPIQYYYESLKDYGNLYVYPTPNSTVATAETLQVIYQSPFADFDAAGDEPDVPQEGLLALKYALAAELAFEYGYPDKSRRDLFAVAEKYKQDFWSSVQEESSLFFKADLTRR